MPQFVIERDIPGAGGLAADALRGIAQKSCAVLDGLGPSIEWHQSYVTGDRIYCIYSAPSQELILEHARQGGFPANRVSEVATVIGPGTAA